MKAKKNETELVKLIPTLDSKAKVAEAAAQLATAVTEGRVDPKEAAVALDAMAKVIKTALDTIHEHVLDELGKYGRGEKITVGRIELQRREAGTKYDYTGCNDPVHSKLIATADAAGKALKEREAFLKALPSPITAVDEETGEVTRIHPAAKTSTTTFAIIYPKD